MLKVSKRAQYGLRAMVCLAKNYRSKSRLRGNRGSTTKSGKVLSTKTISEKEGIPFDFLEKIIMQLEKAKLVNGKKGVLGGYMLSKKPSKISANDVVSVLEDNKKTVDCSFCGRKAKCLTKNVWQKVEMALNKTLESITLEELIKQ